MYKTMFKSHSNFMLLLLGVLCLLSAQVRAQAPEEPLAPATDLTEVPPFINELVDITELTQGQLEQMRGDGLGWGNIIIATRLAERIAADSGGSLTFDDALADVLGARADGKGFGQIANENDLKLGRVLIDGDEPSSANPPPFINQLVEITKLTPEQVEQMRGDGLGWGNIMIAARLAEWIAADSAGTLTFGEALTDILDARAENKGFGQIAHENDLKLGRVVGNGNNKGAAASYASGELGAGPQGNIERRRNQQNKKNVYRQLSGLLGFEKNGRPQKPLDLEKIEKPERPEKPEKPERPERPDKPERPEKPEKPEKPERLEKPQRPERPEKPERPERGPRR